MFSFWVINSGLTVALLRKDMNFGENLFVENVVSGTSELLGIFYFVFIFWIKQESLVLFLFVNLALHLISFDHQELFAENFCWYCSFLQVSFFGALDLIVSITIAYIKI